MQASETPTIKGLPLPGPPLPAEDDAGSHEAELLVDRALLATARAAAAAAAGSEAGDAAAAEAAAREVAADKKVLRLADAAIRQERLDRALQLLATCAPASCFPLLSCFAWFLASLSLSLVFCLVTGFSLSLFFA